MRRRRFIEGVALTGGVLLLDRRESSATRLPFVPGPAVPRFRSLTDDPAYLDARPCFSPRGDTVLFMRSPAADQEISSFWTAPASGGVAAEPFFADDDLQATRPDWSWSRTSYEVAFTGIRDGLFGVYLLDVRTRDVIQLPAGDPTVDLMQYPSWYPNGRSLVVTNYRRGLNQIVRLDLDRPGVLTPLTDPALVWEGMSSVSPSRRAGNPIAFAGQLPVGEYNQDDNQIWIQEAGEDPFQANPGQGRTPWWSPDGERIAYESNRDAPGGQQVYQIFQLTPENDDPVATTPHALAAQHAKWSPSGRSIVFAAAFPGLDGGGIAVVDL